jgi:phosphohistidine phosphatase
LALFREGQRKMKTVLLMRHAKSSWKDSEMADYDRPLNKRGKRDAPRMGRLIRDEGLLPDVILSSGALRARMTAESVADQCEYTGEIVTLDELYGADAHTLLEVLYKLPEEYASVLMIAHNPGVEELVEALTGKFRRMTTAALAYLVLPVQLWQDIDEGIEGKTVFVWRPRELP